MRRLTGRQFNWRRTLRRLRRRLGLPRSRRSQVLIALGVVAVVVVSWGVFDLLTARRDLLHARDDLTSAASNIGTATDADATSNLRQATRDAVTRTARAERRLHRAPLLRVLDLVPIVRNQRRDLLRAMDVAHDAAVAGDALSARVDSVKTGISIRNASVDLAAMGQLADAAAAAGQSLGRLPSTHRGGQWGPLSSATSQLDEVIGNAATRLRTAADTMRVAHRLLGGEGPTRVFLALQNNAEMRDQGMVLSYAVAEVNNGSLRLTRQGSVADLALSAPAKGVTLPKGTAEAFSYLAPLQYWQSVNATADTRIAGASIAAMYRTRTGDAVDGVVALDVPALAALISVTGPVSVPGIAVPISADNASSVLLNDLYAAQGADSDAGRLARQQQLANVTAAVLGRIQTGTLNTGAIVRALGTAAGGGHVWVTSERADDQEALERAGLSGRPGRIAPNRTIHVAVQNATATKLDYFVDPAVEVDVHLTEDGTAVVNTTVTVTNNAPVPTPPGEQFGPDGIVTTVAGLYRSRVHFWGPANGDQVGSIGESGLRLNVVGLEARPGETRSVTFTTILTNVVSNNSLRLRFVPQPRAKPMTLRVKVSGLGWNVTPSGTEPLQWDHTLDLQWRLHR
jgi:hypothetical protein